MSENRNAVLARIACALQSLIETQEALQVTIGLFIVGDEDEHGDERKQSLSDAADLVSNAATSLNEAIQISERLSFNELIMNEYDDDDEGDSEGSEESDEDDPEFADAAG